MSFTSALSAKLLTTLYAHTRKRRFASQKGGVEICALWNKFCTRLCMCVCGAHNLRLFYSRSVLVCNLKRTRILLLHRARITYIQVHAACETLIATLTLPFSILCSLSLSRSLWSKLEGVRNKNIRNILAVYCARAPFFSSSMMARG